MPNYGSKSGENYRPAFNVVLSTVLVLNDQTHNNNKTQRCFKSISQ